MTELDRQGMWFVRDRLGREIPGVVHLPLCQTCGEGMLEPHDHRPADLTMIIAELQRLKVEQTAPAPAPKPKPAGEHMSLADLAVHSGLSERNLRTLIASPVDPLPHHRVGRRVLVKRSDFDLWAAQHRKVGSDIEEKIEKLREREKQTRRRKTAPASRRRAT